MSWCRVAGKALHCDPKVLVLFPRLWMLNAFYVPRRQWWHLSVHGRWSWENLKIRLSHHEKCQAREGRELRIKISQGRGSPYRRMWLLTVTMMETRNGLRQARVVWLNVKLEVVQINCVTWNRSIKKGSFIGDVWKNIENSSKHDQEKHRGTSKRQSIAVVNILTSVSLANLIKSERSAGVHRLITDSQPGILRSACRLSSQYLIGRWPVVITVTCYVLNSAMMLVDYNYCLFRDDFLYNYFLQVNGQLKRNL